MKNGQVDVSGSSTRSRKTKGDSRVQIKPATPPQPGFNTAVIEEAIAAGPAGVRNAQKIAMRHAKKMHEESVDYWRKITEFLKAWTDSSDSFYRARALCACMASAISGGSFDDALCSTVLSKREGVAGHSLRASQG
jgi:hypothetical protein